MQQVSGGITWLKKCLLPMRPMPLSTTIRNAHVAAVLVGGSTARGHADRFSDIELGVFWHQPPTEAERQVAAQHINGDLIRLYPYDPIEEVWCDDFSLRRAAPDQPRTGVLLEVVHYTTHFCNQTLVEVLEQHNPDLLKQNLVARVVDGLPLVNGNLIQQWKDRASVYPQELRLAVINRHAQIDHFWRWETWLERGPNLMMLYQAFSQVQQKLLHVLLGINRVYYFGFKWLDVVSARLTQKPPELEKRLTRVHQGEPATGAAILATLVEDTYDLVEKELPQIDVERLRSIFRFRRPFWEHQPPY